MSSLLFLFEVAGFALVAYWTFTNDQLGTRGGFKGLLRMSDVQSKVAAATRKRVPKWRQTPAEESASPEPKSRWARKPAAAEPACKRRGGPRFP